MPRVGAQPKLKVKTFYRSKLRENIAHKFRITLKSIGVIRGIGGLINTFK